MANEEQLAILHQGVEAWNTWRDENPDTKIDLSEADLGGINLSAVDPKGLETKFKYAHFIGSAPVGINLREVDLSWANLREAFLIGADLSGSILSRADLSFANLNKANLTDAIISEANIMQANLRKAAFFRADLREAGLQGADLNGANLSEANLRGAHLRGADLNHVDLSGADLMGANLSEASLVHANIDRAKISESFIYGVNVWDLVGELEEQRDLIITPGDGPVITVDNIKVAQFIYLVLNNEEIRDVLNTLTSKSVLILGRFALPERKAILDALRNKLREYNLLPIVFDFKRPTDQDFTETIKTLAGISYFVIADVTNPKSSPLELQATVPDYQNPFVPIIQEGEQPFSMMADLHQKYNWVLPTKSYDSIETLMSALKPGIIDPAVEMRNKIRLIKGREHRTESLRDYLDKSL